MSAEAIKTPERTILLPGYVTVIGDDLPKESEATRDALVVASTGLSLSNGPILRPDGWHGLFMQALTGADGEQAHVVLLDEDYSKAMFRWTPSISGLQELIDQSGLMFDANLIPSLFLYPNSTNLSLLLRLLGYKNNIFIVSSDPPLANDVVMALEVLQRRAPTITGLFPANGYSNKKPARDTDFLWCGTGIEFIGNKYRWAEQKVGGTLIDTLKILLQ